MFQHRSKSSMYIMALIVVMLVLFVSPTSAADEAKTSSTDTNDIDYSSEDDVDSNPGEQLKPTGPQPYFEENKRFLRLNPESKTQINCPVKGFNDSIHTVMWYKNNIVIVNGKTSLMGNEFQVIEKHNLLIKNVTKNTSGTYICQIMPGNITQITVLEISNRADKNLGNKSLFLIVVLMFINNLST